MSADVSIEAHLRTLEEELLQPDVRKTATRLDALLAEGFIEFGSSGRVFDKQDIIDSLGSESPTRRSLTDFRAVALGPGVVLTTYRATSYGASGEQPIHSLRSSVWRLLDGRWQIVFHQGTPSEGSGEPHAS
jgi:hypothetical protein